MDTLYITHPPVADGISHEPCGAGTLSAQGGRTHSSDKEPVCLLGSKTSCFKPQAVEVHTDMARKTLGATTIQLPESVSLLVQFQNQELKNSFVAYGLTPVYQCSK